jgi:hypothetical protein
MAWKKSHPNQIQIRILLKLYKKKKPALFAGIKIWGGMDHAKAAAERYLREEPRSLQCRPVQKSHPANP